MLATSPFIVLGFDKSVEREAIFFKVVRLMRFSDEQMKACFRLDPKKGL